jgi:hypothetical protein
MKRPSRSGPESAGPRSKKAEEEQATIIWVDEAGFSLLPMAVRTWAPLWADANPARQADARSSFSNQWHHAGWALVHASASHFF